MQVFLLTSANFAAHIQTSVFPFLLRSSFCIFSSNKKLKFMLIHYFHSVSRGGKREGKGREEGEGREQGEGEGEEERERKRGRREREGGRGKTSKGEV